MGRFFEARTRALARVVIGALCVVALCEAACTSRCSSTFSLETSVPLTQNETSCVLTFGSPSSASTTSTVSFSLPDPSLDAESAPLYSDAGQCISEGPERYPCASDAFTLTDPGSVCFRTQCEVDFLFAGADATRLSSLIGSNSASDVRITCNAQNVSDQTLSFTTENCGD